MVLVIAAQIFWEKTSAIKKKLAGFRFVRSGRESIFLTTKEIDGSHKGLFRCLFHLLNSMDDPLGYKGVIELFTKEVNDRRERKAVVLLGKNKTGFFELEPFYCDGNGKSRYSISDAQPVYCLQISESGKIFVRRYTLGRREKGDNGTQSVDIGYLDIPLGRLWIHNLNRLEERLRRIGLSGMGGYMRNLAQTIKPDLLKPPVEIKRKRREKFA